MIRVSVLMIMLTMIISCGRDHKPVTEKAATAPDFKTVSVSVPYAGDWISETYLESIRKDHSPRKAQEGSEDCFIHIPGQTLVSTFMAYNFHEGGAELVMVKEQDAYALWEKQNDTLVKVASPISPVDTGKIKIGDKVFVRIQAPMDGERPLILESILFAGTYTAENGAKVVFSPNGEVTGLGSYRYYDPIIDYFDAGLQVDQVGLGESKDQLKYFAFAFKKDRLELFELKCKTFDEAEQRCVDVDFGKRVHLLKKVVAEAKK